MARPNVCAILAVLLGLCVACHAQVTPANLNYAKNLLINAQAKIPASFPNAKNHVAYAISVLTAWPLQPPADLLSRLQTAIGLLGSVLGARDLVSTAFNELKKPWPKPPAPSPPPPKAAAPPPAQPLPSPSLPPPSPSSGVVSTIKSAAATVTEAAAFLARTNYTGPDISKLGPALDSVSKSLESDISSLKTLLASLDSIVAKLETGQ